MRGSESAAGELRCTERFKARSDVRGMLIRYILPSLEKGLCLKVESLSEEEAAGMQVSELQPAGLSES